MDISVFAGMSVIGYSDGYIRVFDYQKQKFVGQFPLSDPVGNETGLPEVTNLKFLKSQRNLLASNAKGQIFLLYVRTWSQLSIQKQLVADLKGHITSLDISICQPYYLWAAGNDRGQITVFMRKNVFKGNQYYLEDALKNVNTLKYYQVDSYRVEELWEEGCLHPWKKKKLEKENV